MLALCGCAAKQQVIPSISGTYVRTATGAYSRVWDTLCIREYNDSPGIYLIEHRTGYRRINNGRAQPKEYRTTKQVAVRDQQTGELTERKTGKLYTFLLQRNAVLAGTAVYNKIN
jgi:hypothetical protein